jgi:Holliday junction DNA helicase RuvA
VSGIGKKTAPPIFLELKYTLKPGDGPVSFSAPAGAAPANTVYRDALTGLANLGYDEDMAGPLLKEALAADPDLSVGEALRAVLKAVGKGKM